MIKMLCAYTNEIDEVQDAVEEIMQQLDLEKHARKHSIGILNCYSAFVETGVVKALCKALPFDVVGCTTIGNGMTGHADMMMLSLSVLTSDDVTFTAVLSDALQNDPKPVADAYLDAAARCGAEEPKMALSFLPFLMNLGGEMLLQQLDAVAGGVPIFGTVGCDHTPDYHTTATIYNGEAYGDRVVLALFAGAIHPKFLVSAVSAQKLQKQRATITESQGCVLLTVNNMPVLDYMKTLGLSVGSGLEGMNTIPILVDYNDGTPAVARALYLMTPEGAMICGGNMPEGATLALGVIDDTDVLTTATNAAATALQDAVPAGVIFFSCLSRLAVLGAESTREMDVIRDQLGDLPYQVCYSGGELCPVYNHANEPQNRFHNFSIVACIF
ncbi:MAG: FIST C-terminal domain-containing protein [Oscillospiraceae bacterium]|nr:FIST C-terminal domain-containing protein [Oscillospiraceae bacterium]